MKRIFAVLALSVALAGMVGAAAPKKPKLIALTTPVGDQVAGGPRPTFGLSRPENPAVSAASGFLPRSYPGEAAGRLRGFSAKVNAEKMGVGAGRRTEWYVSPPSPRVT